MLSPVTYSDGIPSPFFFRLPRQSLLFFLVPRGPAQETLQNTADCLRNLH